MAGHACGRPMPRNPESEKRRAHRFTAGASAWPSASLIRVAPIGIPRKTAGGCLYHRLQGHLQTAPLVRHARRRLKQLRAPAGLLSSFLVTTLASSSSRRGICGAASESSRGLARNGVLPLQHGPRKRTFEQLPIGTSLSTGGDRTHTRAQSQSAHRGERK